MISCEERSETMTCAEIGAKTSWTGARAAIRCKGAGGADLLRANEGDDSLDGGSGRDLLRGGADDDKLTADAGDDTLSGGEGDDTLDGELDSDVIHGGPGVDRASYVTRTFRVYVTIAGASGEDGSAEDGPAGLRDTVAATIERIVGGQGNDTLIGNSFNNMLIGGPGADSLFGLTGNDTLLADDGIADAVIDCGDGTDLAVIDPGLDPEAGGLLRGTRWPNRAARRRDRATSLKRWARQGSASRLPSREIAAFASSLE